MPVLDVPSTIRTRRTPRLLAAGIAAAGLVLALGACSKSDQPVATPSASVSVDDLVDAPVGDGVSGEQACMDFDTSSAAASLDDDSTADQVRTAQQDLSGYAAGVQDSGVQTAMNDTASALASWATAAEDGDAVGVTSAKADATAAMQRLFDACTALGVDFSTDQTPAS